MSHKENVGKCAIFQNNRENCIIPSDVLRIHLAYKKLTQLHYSTAIQHQIEMVNSGTAQFYYWLPLPGAAFYCPS